MFPKIILFLLILVLPIISYAQFTEDDKYLLREELIELINDLRVSKNIRTLEQDPTLLKAAENHSQYLVKKKKLSHWQVDSKLAYPAKRVEYFGGDDFVLVGENVLSSSPQKFPLNKKSISNLAQEMFDSWKNSPGHYANMIDIDYLLADLGFELDTENKIIYATHVFGKKGSRIPNQLSDNAFGLKNIQEECNDPDFRYYDNIMANLGDKIHIEGNKIIFKYHSKYFFNKIFTQNNDGIAVDIISREQLTCDGPNVLDMSSIHDGILLKPVFKPQLLSKNTAKSDYRIITQIGTIPDHLIGKELSYSIILIKNGNKCKYLSTLSNPSKALPLQPYEPKLNNPLSISLTNKGIIETQKLKYEFDRGITTPIHLPSVNNLPYNIHSVNIISYSSIEGTSNQNDILHQKRAQSIKNHITKELGINSSKIKIDARENWDKMYFQLKYYDRKDLLDKPKEYLKAFVKKDNSLPWESLLYNQRKSIAIINYYSNHSQQVNKKQLAEMNLRLAIKNKNYPLANKALSKLYYLVSDDSGILFEESINNAIINEKELFQNAAALLSRTYKNDIYKTTEIIDKWMEYKEGINLATSENILYLYTLVSSDLINEWDLPSERLAKVIHPLRLQKWAKGKRTNPSIEINLNLTYLKYGGQINDRNISNGSFEIINDYLEPNATSHDKQKELTLFYNYWSLYNSTNEFLAPKYYNNQLDEDLIFIYLRTITSYPGENEFEDLEDIHQDAIELNTKRWCNWINNYFQLLRQHGIKRLYCQYCKT